jgi:multiple sugar transport system substrate-binding protein
MGKPRSRDYYGLRITFSYPQPPTSSHKPVPQSTPSLRSACRMSLRLDGFGEKGGGAQQPGQEAQSEAVITWWDQFLPLVPLHATIWNGYQADHPHVRVEYTQYNPNDMGQALQLAFSSGQAPDVHSLAGLGLPVSALHAEGWFSPLSPHVDAEWLNSFPDSTFLEGITQFDGEVYSFPIFSFRQHTTLNWFHKNLMENAGFDPETGPRTWDEVRQAAQAMTNSGNGEVYGILLPIQFTARMAAHIVDLAQTAGAPGEIDWSTGEYAYHTEPFIQTFEYLLSFQQDGTLFPASTSLDARNGRARWVTGAVGMFTDGPWNIGVIQANFAEAMDNTGVAQVPVANAGNYLHRGPQGGVFWISSQSDAPAVAADLLKGFNTEEYYIGLAERMDQPPLDLDVVARANVHPSYRQAIQNFQEIVRLRPEPLVRNAAVSKVLAEMTDIRPNLGDLIQGAFSGDITDYAAALKEYSDAMSAERERAVEAVQAQGVEVSLDDWVFSNWDRSQDYTAANYTA